MCETASNGRVDAAGDRVQPEHAVRIERHDVVFVELLLSVLGFQGSHAVLIKAREPTLFGGPEVAAGALDPEHACRIAGQRVGLGGFEARVPPAEVRDSQVRA
jgi:hypothetical protein